MIILLMLPLFFGCTKQTTAKEPYRIAVITMMQGGEFWGALKNGARSARSETGAVLEFLAPVNESDHDGQIACVQQAIDQAFDAIILAPSHSSRLEDVVKLARVKGIKVVLADTSLLSGNADFAITADYHQIGRDMAKYAFSLFNQDEPIRALIIGSLPNSTSMTYTLEGILETFSQNPKASIAYATFSFTDESIAQKITENTLRTDPDVNMVFALEETTAQGVMASLGTGHAIKLVSFGTTQLEIQRLEEGSVDALVVINSFNLGYRSVKAAIDLLKGNKPAEKLVDYALVTKDTMFSEEHQRLLFQTFE